jgi:peptidoglycan/LPS O-acetylase OafA/YrhL
MQIIVYRTVEIATAKMQFFGSLYTLQTNSKTSNRMSNGSGKVLYLDGIRGLAALCVFFHHFGLAFYPAYYTHIAADSHLNGLELTYGESIFRFLTCGSFCVHIFFILSGYVLSRKYFRENDLNIIISSAQKRYLRLFIPVGTTLLLSYVLLQAGAYHNLPVSKITHSGPWLGDFWNFGNRTAVFLKSFLYQTMFLGNNAYDTTLWTMSIELYGSMLVFAVMALTHNTRNKALSFLIIALSLVFISKTLYTCFILGISFNYLENREPISSKPLKILVSTLLMIIGCILGSYSMHDNTNSIFAHFPPILLAAKNTYHIIGGYFVILAVLLSPRMQAFFSTSPLRFLGYISFSLYLLHCLIIGSLSCFLFLKLYGPMSYNMAVATVFAITAAAVMGLSYLMARYVDMKGVQFAGYCYKRYFSKKAE